MKQRLHHIDGLRGLAALSVLVMHATSPLRAARGAGDPLSFLLRLGTHGVELFFVLSGFCLAYPVLAARRREGSAFDICGYAARRLVRILPPFYGAILVLAVLVAVGLPVLEYPRQIPAAWDLVRQAAFLDWNVPFFSGTFWTLAIEMRWYVLFPLLVALWLRAPRVFALLGVVAVLAFRGTTAANADLFALPAFLLGIVAADRVLGGKIDVRRTAFAFAVILGLTIFVEWTAGPQSTFPPIAAGDIRSYLPAQWSLWQLVAYEFVLLVCACAPLRWSFSLAPVVWCGTISYSMYLIHFAPVLLVERTLGVANPVLEAGAAIAAALVASAAFWRLAERPFVETALKGRCERALRTPIARIFTWLGIPPSFRPGPAIEPLTIAPQAARAALLDLPGGISEDAVATPAL